MEFYAKETGEVNNFLALALSSRKNLCIHPEVGAAATRPGSLSVCSSEPVRLHSGQLSALREGGGRKVPQPDGVLHPCAASRQPQLTGLSLLRGEKQELF